MFHKVLKVDGPFGPKPVMSSVCVLRPVFAFCVLRHVMRKKNVRRPRKTWNLIIFINILSVNTKNVHSSSKIKSLICLF